ncbi:MAG: hypothetical protein COA96_06600 [SAR86 cluster bacterium]|uniref:Uncharacterized protein n=1 Tax=SAR86 cluster bacterium TaxID=2030880 RepID=A0A2A5B311_9GAMM|nr:MAG: hypothetical protein COA96_06600 [SAR86 cluster bacterium]
MSEKALAPQPSFVQKIAIQLILDENDLKTGKNPELQGIVKTQVYTLVFSSVSYSLHVAVLTKHWPLRKL